MTEQPDGIIITISVSMLKEKGYKNWLSNFMLAMDQHDGPNPWTYWMRLGAPPKKEVLYVYLCIGNKVRYRALFGGVQPACMKRFPDGTGGTKQLYARAWLILSGPLERAPRNQFDMKGFRGFRYTQKLF